MSALALLGGLVLTATSSVGALSVPLAGVWRYQAGDDPSWSAPSFDDGAWPTTTLPETRGEGAPTGGFVWYRRTVRLDAETLRNWSGVELGWVVGGTPGLAYDLFVDGQRVGGQGKLHTSPAEGPTLARRFKTAEPMGSDGAVVLAMRTWQYEAAQHWVSAGWRWPRGPLALGPVEIMDAQVAQSWANQRGRIIVNLLLGAVLLGVGLFHLLAWRGRRELSAYGWYGALVVVMGMNGLLYLRGEPVWPYLTMGQAARLNPVINILQPFLFWGFVLAFFGAERSRGWYLLLAGLIAGPISTLGLPAPAARTLAAGTVFITSLTAAAFVVYQAVRGKRSAQVVSLGLLVMIAGEALPRLSAVGLAPGDLALAPAGVDVHLRTVGRLFFVATMAFALADQVQRQVVDLDASRRASARFVPQDFLALLGRARVVDVDRGDVAHQDMTVLFADVRGFSAKSEGQSPQETFDWLNRYLAVVEPCVRGHGGFVNQYYGDGIMALFPRADDAVQAALQMQAAVDRAEDLGPGVRIGVGLHAGPLALGTIGGAERLDTGVVGDAVNTAARVESLTKEYDAPVLLTDAVMTRVVEADRFAFEEVATVTPRGKTQAVTLFRVAARDASRAS